MTTEELLEKLELIQKLKCETSTLEIKSAEKGCPKHLYDSLSSFSNQDDGGTIIFGVDEKQNFKEVGVYDPQDIQKKINEQCLQMEPIVRPLLTVVEKDNKFFVSAEIPGVDLVERPVFYQGRGRVKGSYTRIGDSDEPMTEYEVYSYESYRKKYQDDVRTVSRATFSALKNDLLEKYVRLLKEGRNWKEFVQETVLEGACGDDPIALRQFQIGRIRTEFPGELSGPLLGHCGEVQQGNAQTQAAIQLGGVGIRGSHQGNAAAAEYKAIGLTV